MRQHQFNILFVLAIASIGLMFSCDTKKNASLDSTPSPMEVNVESNIQKLADKMIYFGHQSVGDNMISGLDLLLKQKANLGLKIVEKTSDRPFDVQALDKSNGVFAHSKVGENYKALSKIEDFK